MIFSSIYFIYYFLIIFLILYFITPKKFKNYTLLLGSFIFLLLWRFKIYSFIINKFFSKLYFRKTYSKKNKKLFLINWFNI